MTQDPLPRPQPAPDRGSTRRYWLAGGAAAIGGALAYVVSQRGAQAPEVPVENGALDPAAIWSWNLTDAQGQPFSLASYRDAGLVLNFWATWCVPCVREFPQLDRFDREMKAGGWRVVGVAVDEPPAVRGFLTRVPVGFAIAIGGYPALQWAKALGNTQGALPFTVLWHRGKIVKTILGETSAEALMSIANGR